MAAVKKSHRKTIDRRVETAKAAINDVFSDTSVSKERTHDSLIELRDEIQSLLDTL